MATVELAVDGREVPGSLFLTEISSGPVSPGSCTLEGPDLVGCVLGSTCSFLIASRDAYGNLRGGGGDSFSVSSSNASVIDVQSQLGGLYKVRFGNSSITYGQLGGLYKCIPQFATTGWSVRGQTSKSIGTMQGIVQQSAYLSCQCCLM